MQFIQQATSKLSFLMELQWPSFQVLFTFVLVVITVLKIAKRGKTKDSAVNLPPGPWKLPFIGNIHQLVGSQPHHGLRKLAKKYGPLMHLQLGEVSTVVVSSAEYAKEVMKTHDVVFASRPHLLASRIMSYESTNIAFASCGDYWRQLRKICTLELLSTKRVQGFRPLREEEVGNLITWIGSNAGSPINLTEKIYSSTYTFTSRAAFGKKSEDHEKFIDAVKESITVAAGFDLADVFPSAKLLNLIGGIRPTLERLKKVTVKTKVIVNGWAIGRDPNYWTEPESFYPERFLDSSIDYKGTNFEYIPFGAGRRICPGISYGLANVELPLALLLYHFDWKLPNGMSHEDLDMTELFGVTVRRKEDLRLIPIPYHPPSSKNCQ